MSLATATHRALGYPVAAAFALVALPCFGVYWAWRQARLAWLRLRERAVRA